ncbi:hypothetical protein JTE90_026059 [Oedothorax gibbosus]|uniref:UDP-galactose translocator n=1 Tax=Oedothorax gibbosus TaxID=931172 RepID=A0AAV6UCW5_9ARAC|nr:hypothetical protein JTE90_026059 [Oedothorax gibbosus]
MENSKKDEVITFYDSKIDLPLSEKLHMGTQQTLKYVSLVSLTLQNAALNLLMRMVRTQRELFISSTAVLMAEIIKLVACLFMVGYVDEGNIRQLPAALKKYVIKQPYDTLKVAIPSFVYLLQNNLLYVGATHLDAATCQRTHSNPNTPWWLLAIVAACCLSGFAGVYFEKILKGSEVTVWMRNIQLCVSSIPLGLGSVFFVNYSEVSEKGFFYGYNELVWTVILLQAIGGLVVAVVVKYADNILKGFSTSLAIVLSCVFSVYMFNFHLTAKFVLGAGMVIGSIFLYSHPQGNPSVPHKK